MPALAALLLIVAAPFADRPVNTGVDGPLRIAQQGAGAAAPNKASTAPAPAAASGDEAVLRAWAAREPGVKEARRLFKQLKARADAQPDADRLLLFAKAAYWLGLQEEDAKVGDAQRERTFTACRDAAHKVQKKYPKMAGGFFWEAVCRAKLAELTGIVSSAWQLPELIELMEKVDKLEPGYAHGGTARYWGTVIVRTPSFLRSMQGKDLDDAEAFYKQSLTHAPDYAGTWLHLAALELKRDDPKAARLAYDRAIKSPVAKDAEVEAWNRYYRKRARALRRTIDD